jgi:hypothetical protein
LITTDHFILLWDKNQQQEVRPKAHYNDLWQCVLVNKHKSLYSRVPEACGTNILLQREILFAFWPNHKANIFNGAPPCLQRVCSTDHLVRRSSMLRAVR